jgi:hypothetical protein
MLNNGRVESLILRNNSSSLPFFTRNICFGDPMLACSCFGFLRFSLVRNQVSLALAFNRLRSFKCLCKLYEVIVDQCIFHDLGNIVHG